MSIQRNEWIFERTKSVLSDKDYLFKNLIIQMLNKVTTMFKYNDLPETIARKDFETYLMCGGFGIVKEVKDDLYVFSGNACCTATAANSFRAGSDARRRL